MATDPIKKVHLTPAPPDPGNAAAQAQSSNFRRVSSSDRKLLCKGIKIRHGVKS